MKSISRDAYDTKRFRPADTFFIRNLFLTKQIKVFQENIIAGWVSVKDVKASQLRKQEAGKTKPRFPCTIYYVLNKTGKAVHACRKLCKNIFCIKPNRQESPLKRVEGVTEKVIDRLRKKKSFASFSEIRKAVNHNRIESTCIHLHCDMSQSKLRSICNEDLVVSMMMFLKVFSEFNIGFKSPASD
ncbi:hypothetical protein HHI36_016369, partial [Cryptolaemus montrouzieri]